MKIVFRKFNSKVELKSQRELFKECFPECINQSVITNEHYHWKFHTIAGDLKSAEYAAYSNSDLVGYYAALPYQYKLSGKVVKAAMVCDVMTSTKARGKGVFTQLGVFSTDEFSKTGFDFATGFPIRKEVIPGHLKAGWEKYFELPLYGKFIKSNAFLRQRNLEFCAPIFNFFLSVINRLTELIFLPKQGALKLETFSSDGLKNIHGLSQFYCEWSNQIGISLNKDMDFLKWRLGAPGKSYYLTVLRDGDRIVGVLIACEILREGVPCMGILDLAVLKSHYYYSNLLSQQITELAKQNGLEMLLVMASKKWYYKYKLHLNMFLPTPFKFHFICKNLSTSIQDNALRNSENWHLMWIDSDDL
jgi:hypothetical protein